MIMPFIGKSKKDLGDTTRTLSLSKDITKLRSNTFFDRKDMLNALFQRVDEFETEAKSYYHNYIARDEQK